MGQKWPANNARARSQIILIAAGSEKDMSWQQKFLTIRVCEWSDFEWSEERIFIYFFK